MLADELLQLADDLGVLADGKVGIDPCLRRGEPLLLQACDLRLCEASNSNSASGVPRHSASASHSSAAARSA
jgi:hypothetical protein